MPYRIVPCRFNDGERYCLLVDAETGLPLWYPNLYVTTQVRNASKSFSTMDSRLRAIKVLLDFCAERGMDLENLVRSGQLFSLPQLDALRDSVSGNLIPKMKNRADEGTPTTSCFFRHQLPPVFPRRMSISA